MFLVYLIVIQYLYRSDHRNKSNNHLSLNKVIEILLTKTLCCTLKPCDLFVLYVEVCTPYSPSPFSHYPVMIFFLNGIFLRFWYQCFTHFIKIMEIFWNLCRFTNIVTQTSFNFKKIEVFLLFMLWNTWNIIGTSRWNCWASCFMCAYMSWAVGLSLLVPWKSVRLNLLSFLEIVIFS